MLAGPDPSRGDDQCTCLPYNVRVSEARWAAGLQGTCAQLILPQDIQGFLNRLPCNVSDLPILVVRRHGAENTYTEF